MAFWGDLMRSSIEQLFFLKMTDCLHAVRYTSHPAIHSKVLSPDFEQESFLSLSTHIFLPNTILDSDVIETSIVECINGLFYPLFKVAHV